MKPVNAAHLSALATANLYNGESRAIEIANRAKSLTGSPKALEIVRKAYGKYDPFRLARQASRDCWNGGAMALVIARQIFEITGDREPEEIVSRVYSRSDGKAIFECRECGCEFLTPEDSASCCAESWEDSETLEHCFA